MTPRDRLRLHEFVRKMLFDHAPPLLQYFIRDDDSIMLLNACEKAWEIYQQDPDIVGLFYNTKERLDCGRCALQAEKEALGVLHIVAARILSFASQRVKIELASRSFTVIDREK